MGSGKAGRQEKKTKTLFYRIILKISE